MTGVKLISTGGGSVTLDPGSTPNNAIITLPGTTGTIPSFASLTNNGVAYVNGSGQPTSGSVLTFDGSNLSLIEANGSGAKTFLMQGGSTAGDYGIISIANGSTVRGRLVADASSDLFRFDTAGGASTAYAWILGSGYTEAMRLNSTGLGIGTSSPAYKLHVSAASGIAAGFDRGDGSPAIIDLRTSGTTRGYLGATTSVPFIVYNSSPTELMRLDSSGNLGLGVTPSAWSGFTALQVKAAGIASYSNSHAVLSANAYYDGSTWRYTTTDYASAYRQISGQHNWFTVGNGTAGNAISFTQAMTLDASGNLLVGTTSGGTSARINVAGGAIQIADGQPIQWGGGSNYWVGYGSSNILLAVTNGSERMRIDSSGNVGIGTSSSESGVKLWVANSTAAFTWNKIGNSLNSLYAGVRDTGEVGLSSSGAYPMLFYTNGTERMRIDSAGNVLVTSGLIYGYQAAPTAKSTTATLTGAELVVGMLSTTGTSYTVTLPTGTNIDAAVSSSLGTNGCFDWTVVNTASGTITIGANSNTTLGSLTIATGTSAQFRFRKTAANTYTVYRIS